MRGGGGGRVLCDYGLYLLSSSLVFNFPVTRIPLTFAISDCKP